MARPKNENLPTTLTSAALSLFVEKGFAATRLDDVAAQAGVSKGTVYLYFRNKEDLFTAVIRESIVPVLEQGELLVSSHHGDARSLLQLVLRRWWSLIGGTELAGVPKLMIAEGRNFPEVTRFYHENVIQRAHGILGRVLERGIASGEFRPFDVHRAIDVIIAPLLMRAIWRYSFGVCCGATEPCAAGAPPHSQEDADRAFLDLHFDLLISGLLKA